MTAVLDNLIVVNDFDPAFSSQGAGELNTMPLTTNSTGRG